MTKRAKIGKLFWVIVTALPILGLVYGILNPSEYQSVREVWQQRLATFGLFSPIIFILIQILQVVITPISHYTVGAIGGFLYGPFLGGIYNYIGRVLGHITTFFIARVLRGTIVDRFVDSKVLAKYDHIVSGGPYQSLILFFVYFLPLFPDDEVSYLVGISKMPKKQFIWANVFGHLGGSFSLAYIGSGIDTKDPWFWFLFLITLAGFPLIWYFLKKSSNQNKVAQ